MLHLFCIESVDTRYDSLGSVSNGENFSLVFVIFFCFDKITDLRFSDKNSFSGDQHVPERHGIK
jgi:hypothetical protein